jgi:glutaredoxin
VRQLLTEMQVDFVARQVEAYPEDRDQLRDATGHDTIPVVVFADGTVVGGEDEEIVAAIRERFPVPTEARRQHREQWAAHQP